MKNDLQAGLQNIIDAINNLIEPKLGSLRYDKTFRAKVISDEGNNVYGVQINGKNYKAVYTGEKIPVGQIVKVKAPLNNFSDIYIETLPGSGSGSAGNYNNLLNKPILNTNNTGTQVPSATETIQGTISLHKVSKTGNYNDLLNKPTLDFIPTSEKGATNGVAGLDENKKVSKSNLPTDTVYDNNYVHTDNNFTTAMKNKLDSVEEGAEPNKIEIIQRNGSVLPINNKIVNVEVPTKTSDLTNDNGFISSIPVASDTILGGIKVGENLSITADGVLSAKGGGTTDYSVLLNKPVLNTANTKSLAVDSNETINGVVSLHKISKTGSYEDLLNKPTIPTKTSDLENDSGFITNTVDNLTNYYLKSETYTQSEVNNLIGQIKTISIEVVNTLPTTGEDNKIYLVPKEGSTGDVYNEYIWVNNTWELIGSTQVDLTGYATQDWVNNQIKDFLNESQVTQIVNNSLTNYYTKTETYSKTEVNNLLNGKANADDIPTKTSDLTNDSGFIDNSVDNLENYYKKSETYNQTEINNLLSNKADISDIPTKTGDLTNNGDGTTGSKYITNSDLNTELEGKQDKITGGATTIVTNDLTVNRALVSNANGKVAVSNTTSTELGYLSGARSNLQTQIDAITTEGGQPNVIEVVQENGVPLEITNKTVNVTVPTNLENGIATGSLRAIGATSESNVYKLGDNSFAEGKSTKASGSNSHAEGYNTTASGNYSHAEGQHSSATNTYSHAEGNNSQATGIASHAEGNGTIASGARSHAEGSNTKATSQSSHAEGVSTLAGRNAFTVVSGDSAAKTYTLNSVKGLSIDMKYSIKSESSPYYINQGTITAIDTDTNTITVSYYRDIGGDDKYLYIYDRPDIGTILFSDTFSGYSHVEGQNTVATHYQSHAEGLGTIANGDSQHVQGKYNISDDTSLDIIGNGTGADARSNAYTLDRNGNAWYSGNVYVGSTSGTNKDSGSKKIATEEYVDNKVVTDYDKLTNRPTLNTNITTSQPVSASEIITGKMVLHKISKTGDYNDLNNKLNIINGSAMGSLRTVGATSESDTYKLGENAFAEGRNTMASGFSSHAEGFGTVALSDLSHAEGHSTRTGGKRFTIVSGDSATKTYTLKTVVGMDVDYLYAIRTGNTKNSIVITNIDTANQKITVSQYLPLAGTDNFIYCLTKPKLGDSDSNEADNAHAEGKNTVASNSSSHAEGYSTVASGYASHAEGYSTVASNSSSHAEGENTVASGLNSHAEGLGTKAKAWNSHAEGRGTIANRPSQHVQGEYNISDVTSLDIVGNGTDDNNRSNAYTLDRNGNAWFAGEVYVGSTSGTNQDSGSKKLLTSDDITKNIKDGSAEGSLQQINATSATGKNSFAIGYHTQSIGETSVAEGTRTEARGNYSHAEGNNTKIYYKGFTIISGDEGTKTYTLKDVTGLESGMSFMITTERYTSGYNGNTITNVDTSSQTITVNKYFTLYDNNNFLSLKDYPDLGDTYLTKESKAAHAEGVNTLAAGSYSHAEGNNTVSAGEGSHSEGGQTKASGMFSHAEGWQTQARGYSSHSEGRFTISNADYQHVQGTYNIADDTSLDIVGNGEYSSDDSKRSNAYTLDRQGNGWFAGEVYVGSTSGTNKDSGSVKLAKITDIPTKTSDLTNDSGYLEFELVEEW